MIPQHIFLSHPLRQQRGVSLFIVLIFVMLTMLLTLWASRTSLFNEMIVGNNVDLERTFEAAQSLLQDAELDILGQDAKGNTCRSDGTQPTACRKNGSGVLQFPIAGGTGKDSPLALFASLANSSNPVRHCKDGICLKPDRSQQADFWNDKDVLDAMLETGARYGTYTGAKTGGSNLQGNPILAENSDQKGGWYWIETMRTSKDNENKKLIVDYAAVDTSFIVPVNTDPPLIYRITALAKGRKENSQVVLQEVYVLHKLKD